MNDATARRKTSWLLIAPLLAVAAIAAFAYSRWNAAPEVDPVGTMVLAFQKQNELTVFGAQIATVTNQRVERGFGLLENRQTTIVPGTVEYRIDQRTLAPERFRWDAEAQAMELTLPGILISPPNLDASRAQYYRSGPPMTARMRDDLARQGVADARKEAVRQASSPLLQRLARDAAREAMTQNILLPLRAAGFGRARVNVRFADDPETAKKEYMDASRPVEDVLTERARARTTPATKPSS